MIARPDFVFQGHFGVVYRGTFTPMGTACSLEVAIKTIQQSQNKDELAGQEEDLIKEAKIMARANGFLKDQKTFHDNIVNLQGMVFQVVKKIPLKSKFSFLTRMDEIHQLRFWSQVITEAQVTLVHSVFLLACQCLISKGKALLGLGVLL